MQNSDITRIYRQVEPTLKKRAKSYARRWTGACADDLGGAGREAFVKALQTYDPQYGASLDTWIINCANQKMLDECAKVALSRKRFDQIPTQRTKDFGGSNVVDRFDSDSNLDFSHGTIDNAFAQVEIEIDSKELSFDARSLLKARMCGYNNFELTRRKFISRWKLEKAQKELEAYVGL